MNSFFFSFLFFLKIFSSSVGGREWRRRALSDLAKRGREKKAPLKPVNRASSGTNDISRRNYFECRKRVNA